MFSAKDGTEELSHNTNTDKMAQDAKNIQCRVYTFWLYYTVHDIVQNSCSYKLTIFGSDCEYNFQPLLSTNLSEYC